MIFLLLFLALVVIFLIWYVWYHSQGEQRPLLRRAPENPILQPVPEHWWESEAVFNPAAIVHDGQVHLFYRALGHDGISRIGYAHSRDGVHFERLPYPVYDQGAGFTVSPLRQYPPLSYNTALYASGGGWGGLEDPRGVKMGDHIMLSLSMFESWGSIRMALTALSLEDLELQRWRWTAPMPISPKEQTNKNWVLFPEKIHGKFAILHALTPTILIEYVDVLEHLQQKPIQSNNHRSGRPGHWDAFVRGAAAPPIRTKDGWLLLYHGMDPASGSIGYKVGAMLLDFNDPTKILYRSSKPVLEPTEWYENHWKPGVVYASGAVLFGEDLLVYYGGGDKYIAMARTNLRDFVRELMKKENAVQ